MGVDEQLSIELVACEWTLVMGSIGLLSWDRVDSCQGIEWSLVMGSIGLLSWDQLEFCHGLLGGRLVLALLHQRLSTKACARAWNSALEKKEKTNTQKTKNKNQKTKKQKPKAKIINK